MAALGFGFQSRLVQRFLLRRPVAIDLPVVQRVLLAAVALVSICGGGGIKKKELFLHSHHINPWKTFTFTTISGSLMLSVVVGTQMPLRIFFPDTFGPIKLLCCPILFQSTRLDTASFNSIVWDLTEEETRQIPFAISRVASRGFVKLS